MPPKRSSDSNRLDPYRAKRSLDRTPEPAGTVTPRAETGGLFVVHQHAARRLHFDLRLEMEGVLRSWAVPKGPSYDTAEKRLAVHVEDHPLEYGDFEGVIPAGNYGAGAVIVWDRGHWIPEGDPLEGLEKGKLLFELRGYKLRGMWTLVKIKKSEKDWLLIKERDDWAAKDPDELPPESVLSGLTVEELGEGGDRGAVIRRELTRLDVPRRAVDVKAVKLMLAETADEIFSREEWLFEPKLDGYRLLASRGPGDPRLLTRNGNDCSAGFPEVVKAIAALPFDRLVMDGEVVALDRSGKPSFQRLQGRARLSRPIEIRHATVSCPVTYYAFDLLGFEDFDLRALPLSRRKELLRKVLPPVGALRYLEHVEEEGEALYEQTRMLGLEGVVAKKMASPYKGGRSPAWLKIRTRRTGDYVVVGYTAPKGSRGGFGALQLGEYVDGELVYAGRAGSGFSDKQLAEVRKALEAQRRPTPPCSGLIQAEKETTWVEPTMVAEVEYTEVTDEGLLRQPVFLRFRDDKAPEECVRQADRRTGGRADGEDAAENGIEEDTGSSPSARPPVRPSAPPAPPTVDLTNTNKVFWPDEGYTKGDMIEYYRAIAPWLLEYLRNRPVVMTRYPDGIGGKSFFQKDAPGFRPGWIRTERMWSEDTQRELDYFVCDDEASLLYVVNLGTIPLHLWASRAPTLERPDWCVLDLDPKGAPFEHVVEAARTAKDLCDRIELPVMVKTTGSSGLHLMIPLGRQCTHEQSRSLGELLARCIVERLPETTTIVRQVTQREGKVYVDYLQNGSGKLIVAPFSVRALPGAPVSMPLTWREVNNKLDIRSHTITNAPARMRKLKRDPLADVLELSPDLGAALGRLMEELQNGG
jgi:bifunctional non-homologous end joining protein LigD